MTAFISRLTLLVILFLTGVPVKAENPVLYPVRADTVQNNIATQPLASNASMPWKLLPGENIRNIARLMFPQDSITQEKFIRTVILINPQLFPGGAYRSLAADTLVYIPDLRTVHAASAATVNKRQKIRPNNVPSGEYQEAAVEMIASNESNPLLLQFMTQLEQIADIEIRELALLTQHTDSLASQIASLQSMHTLKTQQSMPHVDHSSDVLQEVSINHENLQNPVPSVQPSDDSWENQFTFDAVFILGILLTVLIIILILRNYNTIQEKLTRRRNSMLLSKVNITPQNETSFMNHYPPGIVTTENSLDPSSEMVSQARLIIKQGDSVAAIQFLQQQLAINKFDISGWLLLFELLYSLNNKPDFKKNARRFKRLGIFPDIWTQIQSLGHRLEPSEPLYFDEQKRKEVFFSDAVRSE